jgi:hypothetical protein
MTPCDRFLLFVLKDETSKLSSDEWKHVFQRKRPTNQKPSLLRNMIKAKRIASFCATDLIHNFDEADGWTTFWLKTFWWGFAGVCSHLLSEKTQIYSLKDEALQTFEMND